MAVEKQGTGNFAVKTTGKFECSMDGYVKMVYEITDLTLLLLALSKEIIAAVLPDDLKKAIKYFWAGLNGASGWIGYVVAGLYYVSEEQGFGDQLCEFSGYGYEVIDFLHGMVDFAQTTPA